MKVGFQKEIACLTIGIISGANTVKEIISQLLTSHYGENIASDPHLAEKFCFE